MKLANALSVPQPLLIDPSRLKAYADVAAAAVAVSREKQSAGLAYLLGARPKPSTECGVSIIPIKGIIGKGLSDFDVDTGGCDVDEVGEWLDAAFSDPAISAVLLDVDSPGGTVSGVPELADKVRQSPKPIVAFTSSMCCSAAYWIASAATRTLSTTSASVGSIGVYIALPDYSGLYQANGIKVDVFKAGEFKGAGIPGTSLSDAQRAELQASVEALHADFKSAVNLRRSLVSEESMRGQVFSGKDAAARGLVTGLVRNRAEALARIG